MAGVRIEVDEIKPATPSATDYRLRKVLYFALANLIALAIAGGIYLFLMFGIPEGRGFDHAMDGVRRFLRSHMAVAALAAATPFFASLLVGQYEMRRARARRKRKEAEEFRARVEAELAADRAGREARRAGLPN
jgi:hypothetical protein